MLILRRKKNESFRIGDHIRITIVECAADGVRIAIDAPRHVSILREELSEAENNNRAALAPSISSLLPFQDALSHLAAISPSNCHPDDSVSKKEKTEINNV